MPDVPMKWQEEIEDLRAMYEKNDVTYMGWKEVLYGQIGPVAVFKDPLTGLFYVSINTGIIVSAPNL
jgi:hypothetical protein